MVAYLDQASREKTDVERLAMALWTGLHGHVTLSYAARKMAWPSDEAFADELARAWLGPARRGGA